MGLTGVWGAQLRSRGPHPDFRHRVWIQLSGLSSGSLVPSATHQSLLLISLHADSLHAVLAISDCALTEPVQSHRGAVFNAPSWHDCGIKLILCFNAGLIVASIPSCFGSQHVKHEACTAILQNVSCPLAACRPATVFPRDMLGRTGGRSAKPFLACICVAAGSEKAASQD